jgi:hypothetical protein
MVVADGTVAKISIRHTGYQAERIVQASQSIIEAAPKALERIAAFRNIRLGADEQLAFATAALSLKYAIGEAPIDPSQLLQVRRKEDYANDLWTTVNRVQENIIKGGLAGRASTGRRTTTREVRSVGEDLRLNRALWTLAESLQALKAA